jgi:hypothetical protein
LFALNARLSELRSLARACAAPALIAVGLILLAAATCSPAGPAVTGMALVALGATYATTNRAPNRYALMPIVGLHLFVYASLYVLFVGAVCHGASLAHGDGYPFLLGIDLVGSTIPMALAVQRSVLAIYGRA